MFNIINHQENSSQDHSEISLHIHQNDCDQKYKKQQILCRMWRTGKTCAFLVGSYIGATTMENTMEACQKLKVELSYDPASEYLSKERRNTNLKRYMHP